MKSRQVIFGLVLVALGALLLARAADWLFFDYHIKEYILPLALVAVGLWLIVRKKRQEDRFNAADQEVHTSFGDVHIHTSTPPPPSGSDSAASFVHEQSQTTPEADAGSGPSLGEAPSWSEPGKIKFSKTLGDMFVDCRGQTLQNIEISAGVGDLEIRLHGGRLAAGLNRIVISGFIGDIRVYVPQDMAYFAHCSNFVGDVDMTGRKASGFGNNIDGQSANYEKAQDKVYIAVNTFIGDVKIFQM
ncbi:MAG: cell wall-active antibiotics response protein LiaF [bacterium]